MEGKGKVFLRDATGLVRAWSVRDAFYYVVLQLSVGLWILFTISTNAYAYPGGSPLLGGIFATALFAIPSAVYAMLMVAMPRSGGDYVFQTRVLNQVPFMPLISYMAIGLWLIGNAWFIPFVWSAVGGGAWAPFLAVLGVETGNQSLISLAGWITTPYAVFLFGFVIVGWMWLVNAFGMRAYAKVQFVFFWCAIIFSVLYYGWILFTPTQTFINSFNAISPALGGPSTNAYQGIISLAAQNGFSPDYSFSWTQSLGHIASWSAVMVIGYYTALGAEIKSANSLSSQMKISVGACIIVGLLNTILVVGVNNLVGIQFNAAAGYLNFIGKWPLTVPPYAGLYTMALGGGLILPLIALLYFNSWTWMNYPNVIPYNTRISMAMAFDRMLPEKMAAVNERFHIPLFNVNVWCLATLGLIFLAYYLPTFSELFLLDSFCLSTVIILSCLAGVFLPYSKSARQAYISSGLSKYKVGNIPVITILGIISVLIELFVDYSLLSNPLLGVAGGNLAFSGGFTGIIALFFGLIFVFYKYHNKRRGIDVSQAFQQIPPE
ncbi:MAG: amino acid permease [Candidatus Bathyarchaeia archaeon]